MSIGIVWFRRDLRLDDNPAWAAASREHDLVMPLLILEPRLLASAGPHRRAAFLGAARRLDDELRVLGGRLRVERGDPATIIPSLIHATSAHGTHANADVTRHAQRRDRAVTLATDSAVSWTWGTLVHPPHTVTTARGTLSKVFTPFWRRWATLPLRPEAVPAPVEVTDDPATGLPTTSSAAMVEPTARWQALVDDYHDRRDLPAAAGTSRLSTSLRFGTVSPRRLVEQIGTHTPGREAFVRQLAWRDWYAHTTLDHPDIDRRAIAPAYDEIRWRRGAEADRDFDAWRAGRTGYPMVDAGMRELAATGWMHNRARMLTASFLVKDLLIDWRRGERHFRHLLSDGEPAQNAGNWQWVAGSGPDAAPYFRVLNPVVQSRRFDPAGAYIRRWVPELARLDDRAVHAPWDAAPLELAGAEVVLGDTYPAPIVDHAEARELALAAYSAALGR